MLCPVLGVVSVPTPSSVLTFGGVGSSFSGHTGRPSAVFCNGLGGVTVQGTRKNSVLLDPEESDIQPPGAAVWAWDRLGWDGSLQCLHC